jgi:Relaxase/Mobilisation nuclease domain
MEHKMTAKIIDGVIKDWGERLNYERLKPRKGRNIRGGKLTNGHGIQKKSGSITAKKLIKAVRKVPEVMVKISGGGKNMSHIKEHMDYISRNGEIDLEDENGDIHRGKRELADVKNAWAKGRIGIPEEGDRRKEAFNIIFSMPPGTDRDSVKEAVRAFAADEFKDHQYVFASHDDEEHTHVHLCVKAADQYGIRLNPRKNDLQRWRELFVDKLSVVGIEANATPRWSRGVVQKPEKQAIKHISKRKGLTRISQQQEKDAHLEVDSGVVHVNPYKDKIIASRRLAHNLYGSLAKGLLKGDKEDKLLALEITKFVQNMPSTKTRHEDLVVGLGDSKARAALKENVLSRATIEIKNEKSKGKDRDGR